jgi:arsenate reductase-like glutaredoxin family protein
MEHSLARMQNSFNRFRHLKNREKKKAARNNVNNQNVEHDEADYKKLGIDREQLVIDFREAFDKLEANFKEVVDEHAATKLESREKFEKVVAENESLHEQVRLGEALDAEQKAELRRMQTAIDSYAKTINSYKEDTKKRKRENEDTKRKMDQLETQVQLEKTKTAEVLDEKFKIMSINKRLETENKSWSEKMERFGRENKRLRKFENGRSVGAGSSQRGNGQTQSSPACPGKSGHPSAPIPTKSRQAKGGRQQGGMSGVPVPATSVISDLHKSKNNDDEG